MEYFLVLFYFVIIGLNIYTIVMAMKRKKPNMDWAISGSVFNILLSIIYLPMVITFSFIGIFTLSYEYMVATLCLFVMCLGSIITSIILRIKGKIKLSFYIQFIPAAFMIDLIIICLIYIAFFNSTNQTHIVY